MSIKSRLMSWEGKKKKKKTQNLIKRKHHQIIISVMIFTVMPVVLEIFHRFAYVMNVSVDPISKKFAQLLLGFLPANPSLRSSSTIANLSAWATDPLLGSLYLLHLMENLVIVPLVSPQRKHDKSVKVFVSFILMGN